MRHYFLSLATSTPPRSGRHLRFLGDFYMSISAYGERVERINW
jgi:hypothetical protein